MSRGAGRLSLRRRPEESVSKESMENADIKLYAACVRELENEDLYERAMDFVSPARREKVLRYGNNLKGARQSLGAGVLLEKALLDAGARGSKIEIGENGKPYIAGLNSVFFNLSHSEDMAICAASRFEIGCDIERMREERTRAADRFFAGEERVFAGKSTENFYRMWTLKESFLKVTGKGLALPLSEFEVTVAPCGNISVRQRIDGRHYMFREYFCFEGYACSLCAATEPGGPAFGVFEKTHGEANNPDRAGNSDLKDRTGGPAFGIFENSPEGSGAIGGGGEAEPGTVIMVSLAEILLGGT